VYPTTPRKALVARDQAFYDYVNATGGFDSLADSSEPLDRHCGTPSLSNATIRPTYGCASPSGWTCVIAGAAAAPANATATAAARAATLLAILMEQPPLFALGERYPTAARHELLARLALTVAA
jgi:hypothetical protein